MELLAPAGDLEKLKWAVVYGADVVYFGIRFGACRGIAALARTPRHIAGTGSHREEHFVCKH